MLQTRAETDRSGRVRIAVEMQREGLIDEKTAVLRVGTVVILHPMMTPRQRLHQSQKCRLPGAAVGRCHAADAEEWAARGGDPGPPGDEPG